jgi:hypothetical protein
MHIISFMTKQSLCEVKSILSNRSYQEGLKRSAEHSASTQYSYCMGFKRVSLNLKGPPVVSPNALTRTM